MTAIRTGIRLIRKIAVQSALKPYIVEELAPGPSVTSDDDLAEFVRQTGVSNHHPISSCAMGTGPNTVVDPRLEVTGCWGCGSRTPRSCHRWWREIPTRQAS